MREFLRINKNYLLKAGVISITSLSFFSLLSFLAGCQGENPADILAAKNYKGYVAITSVTTDPATGPGLVTVFNPAGELYSVVADYVSSGTTYATGIAFKSPDQILLSVEPSERFDVISLVSGNTVYSYSNTNITANPFRQMTYSEYDGSFFVTESNVNTVEKVSSTYQRTGAPFIPATVTTGANTCTITTVSAVAVVPTTGDIAVLTSNRLNIYDKDGNCSVVVSGAPVNSNTPWGLAYHKLANKFLITRVGDHSVWSINPDGTGATQVYLSSSFINTPRAIDVDDDGFLYVSSSGSDTIEKLDYDYAGTGTATRALSGPFLGPNVFTQNVQQITVMKGGN